MEWDLFGCLLALLLKKELNMEYCLSFLLSPIPPALCTVTGEMNETCKTTLAKTLKTYTKFCLPPIKNDIDGFAFLYSLGNNVPQTFQKFAEHT